ncbi:MAG: hypothetical protein V3W34_17320 [Phycisphaerae bacterium]
MARPRSYVQDPKGKTVDGLSFHKASSRYYSINKDGQRKYWGRDKDAAIERHRASLNPRPLRKMTDEEAVDELCWAGLDEDDINPELIQMAKRGRFFFSDDWIDANPDQPLAIFANSGKMPRRPRPEPKPEVNPDGVRLLTQVGPQWKSDKQASPKPPKDRTIRDYLHDGQEFGTSARRQSLLDIAGVNKAFMQILPRDTSYKWHCPGNLSPGLEPETPLLCDSGHTATGRDGRINRVAGKVSCTALLVRKTRIGTRLRRSPRGSGSRAIVSEHFQSAKQNKICKFLKKHLTLRRLVRYSQDCVVVSAGAAVRRGLKERPF